MKRIFALLLCVLLLSVTLVGCTSSLETPSGEGAEKCDIPEEVLSDLSDYLNDLDPAVVCGGYYIANGDAVFALTESEKLDGIKKDVDTWNDLLETAGGKNRIRIRMVKYSEKELLDIRDTILDAVSFGENFAGIGIDYGKNRLELGLYKVTKADKDAVYALADKDAVCIKKYAD